MIKHDPAPAITITITMAVTAAPTANTQGETMQISADGIYVI